MSVGSHEFFLSIFTYSTIMSIPLPSIFLIGFCAKKMEDWKKWALCLDRLTLELEEERKLIVIRKQKKIYKEIKP
jgi:hypothetical protein